MTERQKEILMNLLLEKMQTIANFNPDMIKALNGYKEELHVIFNLINNLER